MFGCDVTFLHGHLVPLYGDCSSSVDIDLRMYIYIYIYIYIYVILLAKIWAPHIEISISPHTYGM